MDELESELRTLDREIAKFVLEAFQREGPEALREQLAAAMADSLRPLQRSLESLDAALADTRGDLAHSAEAAQAADDRRAALLHQAIARLRAASPAGGASPGLPVADDDQPDLFQEHPDGSRRRFPETPRPRAHGIESGWWRRNLAWAAAAGVALVIAAGAAVYILNPAGLPGLGPRPAAGAAPSAAGEAATGAVAPSPDQEGLARVLGQVGLWSGERRKAALDALCGPGADIAGCPELDKRWAPGARTRKEADAALAVTVAALAEADGCAAPPPAGKADEKADADPEGALRCLLTEAGRAPRP